MLVDHLRFWGAVLDEFVPTKKPRMTWSTFNSPVLADRMADSAVPALDGLAHVALSADPERDHGVGYYHGAAISVRAEEDGRVVDLGDGGVTDWTARLLGDAKERCVISCIATERLAALAGKPHE